MFGLKNADFVEMGGAGAMAVVDDYVASGKLPVLKNVKDLDLWTDGVVIAGNLWAQDHVHGAMGEALDGAAIYAAGDLIGKVFNRFVLGATTPASGTSASVDYLEAPMQPAPAIAASAQDNFAMSAYGDVPSFHGE